MTGEKEDLKSREKEEPELTERQARERLELLFSDSVGEDYPFTAWFAEGVRTAIKVLEREEERKERIEEKKRAKRRERKADA